MIMTTLRVLQSNRSVNRKHKPYNYVHSVLPLARNVFQVPDLNFEITQLMKSV